MNVGHRLRASWRSESDRWLLGCAVLALAAALLNPGLMLERPLFDHVIVLDVTQSMGVTDMRLDGKPVSRLAYAKHALRQSLLRLPCGSKVGWAIFTEYRSLLLLAPIDVCANLSELRSTLDGIGSRMAWSGNSEIAKGLHSAIGIARQLPDRPSLVFVTDGQEAPPIDPRHRRSFDDEPGEVMGLVVGVGDALPSRIPKIDPDGRPLGFWGADDVLQTDPRYPESGRAGASGAGTEHLSALHESYLRLLASDAGMAFHRMVSQEALEQAMTAPPMARPGPARVDAHVWLALLAFALLLLRPVQWMLRARQPKGF